MVDWDGPEASSRNGAILFFFHVCLETLKKTHSRSQLKEVQNKSSLKIEIITDLFRPLLRLKGRMRDLDKPLKIVNRTLWEEMRNSSEKEVLKDNNFTVFFSSYNDDSVHFTCLLCHMGNVNSKRKVQISLYFFDWPIINYLQCNCHFFKSIHVNNVLGFSPFAVYADVAVGRVSIRHMCCS